MSQRRKQSQKLYVKYKGKELDTGKSQEGKAETGCHIKGTEADTGMLRQGKLSQILECFNKGNKARYWNTL